MRLKKILLFLLLMQLLATGCGYRFGNGALVENYSTICVPYAEGDDEGIFTAALIQSLSERGAFAYRSYGAELALEVCLNEPFDTNIGFAFAPDKKGGFTSILVSNEARLNLSANVTLIEKRTGEKLFGPIQIYAWLDYDFEPDLSNVNFHELALGQLEMHNLAQDIAFASLCKILADKIVDYVNHHW